MNKNVTNNILLTGGVVNLDKFVSTACIEVKEDSILNSMNLHNNLDLKIKINKNKMLTLNIFDYAISLDVNLYIELDDGASLVLNDAFIAEEKYNLNIDTRIYGDDINVSVNVRGINELNGSVAVILNGTVAGETKNSRIDEYAKILNKSDNSNVLIPNLIVNTNEVEANHGVTVGGLDEDGIFYLMSKGISLENSIKIMEEGFLLSIMDDEVKERMKKILVGR